MSTHDVSIAHVDVLIAEDDDLLRGSLRLLLEVNGYRCAEAADGHEAVERAREYPPRCVILDLSLPEMDGFAVARTLRADPRTSTTHIHCLTGLTDPSSRQQAAASGVEEYLTKPVDPDLLLAVVRPPAQSKKCVRAGLTLIEAEQLLDWLEQHGCKAEAVVGAGGVTVCCACPPEAHLARQGGPNWCPW